MKHRAVIALTVALCLFSLCGCRTIPVTFRTGQTYLITCGSDHMSEGEVRLVALQYKCHFENLYMELLGEDFWTQKVSENMDFESYVKEYFVYRECKALLYLCSMADLDGVRLDELYDKDFRLAAEDFYASLSRDELRFADADVDDVEKLMRRYALASLEIEKATESGNPEVSEEESRVADIQIIRVNDRDLAYDLSERLENGESFLTLAQENTLDSRIDYSVYKGELSGDLDDLVFGMENYEISDVTEVGDSYCIVRLVNSYNVLQSTNHKRDLMAERKYLAWESAYASQLKKLTVNRNNRVYENIALSRTGDFPYTDLFGKIPVIN